MSQKNFRKISHPKMEISPYLSNFRKEVTNKCTNIPGITPKNFRKISHAELEISLYLFNFSKKVSQLTD